LEDKIPFDPELLKAKAMEKCVHNFSGALLKVNFASNPNIARVTDQGLR
jgi:hypothetical protein